MTFPDERTHAVLGTLTFLYDLLDPELTPRVPKYVRDRACRLLRHYPHQGDMYDPARAFDPHRRRT